MNTWIIRMPNGLYVGATKEVKNPGGARLYTIERANDMIQEHFTGGTAILQQNEVRRQYAHYRGR